MKLYLLLPTIKRQDGCATLTCAPTTLPSAQRGTPTVQVKARRKGLKQRQPLKIKFSHRLTKRSVRYGCLVASTSSPSTSSVAALRTNNKSRLNSTEGFLAATHVVFCLTVHSIAYLKTFVKPFFQVCVISCVHETLNDIFDITQ